MSLKITRTREILQKLASTNRKHKKLNLLLTELCVAFACALACVRKNFIILETALSCAWRKQRFQFKNKWIKRAANLHSYTPTKLFLGFKSTEQSWIILLCTSSIVTGTCLSPFFPTGVDVRICVVFLLLRISRFKLYLHRTNEALLICWSMISWSCQGTTCFVELLLERLWCHQFSDFSLAETIFVLNWGWWGTPFTSYFKIVLPETGPFAIVFWCKFLSWRDFLEV